jgi:putative oxidoreductase
MVHDDRLLDSARVAAAMLLLRIAAGIVFIYHGAGILFGAFAGPGISGFAHHAHLASATALFVGLAQFCGGIAVLTGVLARLGAACIVIVMFGAIIMVHLPHGFDASRGGMEYALTQLVIAFSILLVGPGPYSATALITAPRSMRTSSPDATRQT